MTFSELVYHLKYPFKLWMYELIDQWVMAGRKPKQQKKILIYRLDLIGDYLMCRPFFKSLKDDPKFMGFQFTFGGNKACKDLAEWLDSDVFDDFIWIDRARFINSITYRFQILKQVRDAGFDMVIYPSHTRQYWLESVVRVSGTSERITGESVGKYMNAWELKLTQSRYSKVISTGKVPLFEFFRNRNFFSALSEKANLVPGLKTSLPDLIVDQGSIPSSSFIVLAPGASTQNRLWPLAKFASLVREIWKEQQLEIVVIGSPAESSLGQQLQTLLDSTKIHNLAGKLSLSQSMILLSKSKLLISNESAPVHMAATTGTPCICVSQGNHFGRWNPYPKEVSSWISTVYPAWFQKRSIESLAEEFHDGSKEDISQISVEEVWKEVQSILLKPEPSPTRQF